MLFMLSIFDILAVSAAAVAAAAAIWLKIPFFLITNT
jgi:hypothetical protein